MDDYRKINTDYYYIDTTGKTFDFPEVAELKKKVKRYENIISAIANIDTYFDYPIGNEREWDDKEALKEIESLVAPVWKEICERARKSK